MKPLFYIAAAVMVAVALALLLLPLLKHGRQAGRSRAVFALMLLIALAVPVGTVILYLKIGTPEALDGVPTQAQANKDVGKALDELRAHLASQPSDAQGWMLLAQAELDMQQPDRARKAFDQVLTLRPNDTVAMVGWAQADSTARPDHLIEGRGRELLEQAVKLEPDNQRALWLLGISDFQQGRFTEAASTWRTLQPLLEPGSTVAQAVAQQIALADARAGHAPVAASTTAPPAPASQEPALQVRVTLAPALKDKLAAGDTLFVYARAEHGPPMPLAVARLDAARWPATVTLTDAMSMMPAMRLSSVPRVTIGARISHSGDAIPHAGDLEGNGGIVDVHDKAPVNILIDKVHD